MSKLTVKDILHKWIKARAANEKHVHIAYHQMPQVVEWAKKYFGITHASNTYERELRKIINEDYPHRFKDVSDAMGKRHSVWLLLPNQSNQPTKKHSTMEHIKTHKDKYIKAENNQDLRAILRAFKTDHILEGYDEFRDRNGWYCINGGLYLRSHFEEKSGNTKVQIAHDLGGYQNKYLRAHAEKIYRKIAMEIWPDAQIGIWGKSDGGALDIMGRGPSSQLNYLEWIV